MDKVGTEELLPCPFCGAAAYLIKSPRNPENENELLGPALVQCWECDASQMSQDEDEAIAAWNKRIPLRQQAQPTREEGWRVKELEWTPENWWPGIDGFEANTELGLSYAITGSDESGWTAIRRHDAQTERFDTLDGAKAWGQADYASRISSALLPIDAPAREDGGEAVPTVDAKLAELEIDTLSDGRLKDIRDNTDNGMAARVMAGELLIARAKLTASPAEAAAHSLQVGTEWIKWHGGEFGIAPPVSDEVSVQVRLRSGYESDPDTLGKASAWYWHTLSGDGSGTISAYRVVGNPTKP